MELLADCLPCLLGQALNATRKAAADEQICSEVTRQAADLLAHSGGYSCAPALCRDIYLLVRQKCGSFDPYRGEKDEEILLAKRMLPDLLRLTDASSDPMLLALHIAASGNLIDTAVNSRLVPNIFPESLNFPFSLPASISSGGMWKPPSPSSISGTMPVRQYLIRFC